MNSKEKYNKYIKEYRKRDYVKKKNAAYARKWRKTKGYKIFRNNYYSNSKNRFANAKFRAKKRKLSWSIKFKDYEKLLNKNCYYCNISCLKETGSGLDRINNNRGYRIDNVITCCGKCNKTRGDRWTVEETKIMITAVMKFKKEIT